MKRGIIISIIILFVISLLVILSYLNCCYSLNCKEGYAGLIKWGGFNKRIVYKCLPDPINCSLRNELDCEKDNDCIKQYSNSCPFCDDIKFINCIPKIE